MVVETVFPGGSDEHSTVSTRLDTADITVSSSDERFLSALAEAICSYTLEDTERNYLGNVGDLPSNNIFGWLQKPQKNCSVDSSICVYRISEGKIVRNARKHVDKLNLAKGKSVDRERKLKRSFCISTSLMHVLFYHLEALCKSVVKEIRDALGWPGDIMFDADVGAWTGKLPHCLRNKNLILHAISGSEEDATNCSGDVQTNAELSSSISSSETINMDAQSPVQDIASFQVVLSGDGKMIGFQPTSRVAVNHWASNPLAKVLYGGRKLSPGLLEPTLRVLYRHEVVLMELLMSVNPESSFALARPTEQSCYAL